MASTAIAALTTDSVYPNLGKVGEDLEVTISGKGFNGNTRVAMSLDAGNAVSIIGSANTPGSAYSIYVSGSRAYVADGESGLQVIDISNPTRPTIIGSVDTPGYAAGIYVSGNTACVADGSSGLQVIDISNPTRPTIIGSMGTPGEALDVCISGNRAYVGGFTSGLQVIDISNPTRPTMIGSVDTLDEAWGVYVSGNTAYVADGGSGLQVIDISDPARPAIIGWVDTPGKAYRVTVSGSTAYVADSESGLQVIDISNPTRPTIIGSVDTPGSAWDVYISGSEAYVADFGSGLQVIDMSNPTMPTIIGWVATPGNAAGVYVTGSRTYMADQDWGLQVIDISNPTLIGRVDTPGMAFHVTVSGSTAYVADCEYGLQVVDISTPAHPTSIGSVETPGEAWSVYVSGSRAYVANGGSGLQVIDISTPTRPTIIGSVATPGYAGGVYVSGSRAYVADGGSGLQVIDISNPARPTIIGSVDTDLALKVYVSGSRAYVADGESGLQVIDISSPTRPTIIGSVDTPDLALNVYVSGSRAYVADGDSGLQVIDISNPAMPTIIGSVATPGYAGGVYVSGNTAYVADGGSGLQVIDISDPARPAIIGWVDTPIAAVGVYVSDGTAYVASGESGLSIVPVPVEIDTITINSDTRITCTLPSPQLAGAYNLRVFNASESDEMKGAVTFLKATDFQPKSNMKAIIVAGGGDYAGNTLWPSTRLVTNQAYIALISQGYTKENIYYLGPHTVDLYPEDGIFNDVDAEATSANLSWAINTWAQDASELFLFMTDHGKSGTFQLNQNEQYFQAEDLDAWLDSLQMKIPGRVVVVYDACNSGSFIPLLRPPSSKLRIVITSAQANERAWFMNQGVNSFSYQFWSSAWLRGNLYDAFLDAKNMMGMDQTALLDADGDGNATTKDDQTLAGAISIGRGRSAASLPPSIIDVSADQTLNGPTIASLWARLETAGLKDIDSVWAVVVSPDQASVSSDIPVTDLPRVDLSDSNGDGTFEGAYAGFMQKGSYRVIVYAKDKEGLYSFPKTFNVSQQKGIEKDGGYNITSEIWTKAVLQVSGNPVTLVWKEVGTDLTPTGDQVISGYFYADPKDFPYGSRYNPELFVKIYIARSGWCNIAFNHVTVDNVTVYSAHKYAGAAQQTGTILLSKRLVEHQYNGVAIQNTPRSDGVLAPISTDSGYNMTSGLWAKAFLQPSIGPVTLIWKEVGSDITPSGDKVVSGYFYADPGDFAYGSEFNPEVFVKIYIAKSGWCNIAFNHVTVDNVSISSAHNYAGSANQSGTASLNSRLVEDPYDGVKINGESDVTVPSAPMIGEATAGDGQATVTFTAPASTGGSAITGYIVTSNPGGKTVTGTASPIIVTGLTNGTAYTFTVQAINAVGKGPASAVSNSVTPQALVSKPNLKPYQPSDWSDKIVVSTNKGTFNDATVLYETDTIYLDWAVINDSNTDAGFFTTSLHIDGVQITYSTHTGGVPAGYQSTVSDYSIGTLSVGTHTMKITADNTDVITESNEADNTYTKTITVNKRVAAPGAPTIGTVTAGNGQATVTFTAPASNGGSAITSYAVTSNPGGKTATGTDSPITVTGLTNGTVYTFTVKAQNVAGWGIESTPSNPVKPGPTVPGAPTMVTATAGNGQATVSFTAPASNGGSTITRYTVTSNPGEKTATGTASPITVSDLTNGTAYRFTVKAENAAGTGPESTFSSPVTPADIPRAPTMGTATASGDGRATVTFIAPTFNGGSAIIDYTVTSNPGGRTATGTASPISVTGLSNGTTYSFTVKARNAIGESPASARSNFVTIGVTEGSYLKIVNRTGYYLNIYLDGTSYGGVAAGFTKTFDIAPGIHTLQGCGASIGVLCSPEDTFSIKKGETYEVKYSISPTN